MPYDNPQKKKSQFTTDDVISNTSTFDYVKAGVNKKTSWSNLKAKLEAVFGLSVRLYETESAMVADTDLVLGDHAIVEENRYALYEMTNVAAAQGDVTLSSGLIATQQGKMIPNEFETYAEVRALKSSMFMENEILTFTGDGIAGDFKFKTGTVTDNGGTLIVPTDDSNRYFERVYSGAVWVEWFGAVGDYNGVSGTNNTPAFQSMFDYTKDLNLSNRVGPGSFLFNSEVDIGAPGAGDEGYRNTSVVCDHEAKFYGASNSISIFNISGQRRLKWTGGWFKRADMCFKGTDNGGTMTPPAYSFFNGVIFDGESANAIKRAYKAPTSIGVFWENCLFGTDQVNNSMDIAVELDGTNINQTNVNKYTNCVFINCVRGVLMPDSSYARISTSFINCWFESLDGYAITAGTNTKALSFDNCYFEACGSASEKPVILNNARVTFKDCTIVGLQNNNDAFIESTNGTIINTIGVNDFGSLSNRVFVEFDSITTHQNLNGVLITDQSGVGTNSHKDLLFSVPSAQDEQYISWNIPAISSTLTDSTVKEVKPVVSSSLGCTRFLSETVNLSAVSTDYDVCNINVKNANLGVRVSIEAYQTIQGVGHSGRYYEVLAYWDGASWSFTTLINNTTNTGLNFTYTGVDSTNFKIQAQRTVGGATNTPLRALVIVHQASDNILDNLVAIT